MAKTITATKTARKTAGAPSAAAKSVMKEADKHAAAKGSAAQQGSTPATQEGASATPPQAPHIDLKRYIDALAQAQGFSKASVDLEVAVCLSIFAEAGDANITSKREVMKAYVGAGWKCAAHTEADYKTVSRRLNASAALFERMGGKKAIDEVTAGVPEDAHIGALVNHLATKYELTSLNAVWAAAGRPVKNVRDWTYDERTRGENTPPSRPRTPASQGEGASAEPPAGVLDTTNATVLTHGMLQLVIPNDCPEQDLMDMLAELMSFVHERNTGAGAQAAPVTKTEAKPASKRASRTTH